MTNNDNRGSRIMNRSVTMLGLVAALVATPVAGQWQSGQPSSSGQDGLADLVRLALDKNRDLTAAREQYVTSQEQVSEA